MAFFHAYHPTRIGGDFIMNLKQAGGGLHPSAETAHVLIEVHIVALDDGNLNNYSFYLLKTLNPSLR